MKVKFESGMRVDPTNSSILETSKSTLYTEFVLYARGFSVPRSTRVRVTNAGFEEILLFRVAE